MKFQKEFQATILETEQIIKFNVIYKKDISKLEKSLQTFKKTGSYSALQSLIKSIKNY